MICCFQHLIRTNTLIIYPYISAPIFFNYSNYQPLNLLIFWYNGFLNHAFHRNRLGNTCHFFRGDISQYDKSLFFGKNPHRCCSSNYSNFPLNNIINIFIVILKIPFYILSGICLSFRNMSQIKNNYLINSFLKVNNLIPNSYKFVF